MAVCTYNTSFLIISVFILTVLMTITLNSFAGIAIYEEKCDFVRAKLGLLKVYCNELSLSPYEDAEIFDDKNMHFSVDDDGKYICASDSVSKIVNQIVERKTRLWFAAGRNGPQYLSCGDNGDNSLRRSSGANTAYFTKVSESMFVTDKSLETLIVWDTDEIYSHIDKHIVYQNGELTISEGQYYFVYASILLNATDFDTVSLRLRFSFRLCKRRYGYESTLLGETHLVSTNTVNALTSLQITGHVFLQPDDVIYIKVSNAKRLLMHSKGNLFGMFPL